MKKTPAASRGTLMIYVLPALADLVLGLLLFVATVRATRMGGEALRTASVLAAFSLVYVASCILVGRLTTTRNAAKLVLVSVVLLAATCGLLAFVDGYVPMLVLVGVAGVAGALFFPPFQALMKDVDQAGGRSLPASTGLYTFSWSIGAAAGPLVSGFLLEAGEAAVGPAGASSSASSRLAFLLGSVVSVALVGILLPLVRKRSAVSAKAPVAGAALPPPDLTWASYPDRAWLAWVVGGAGLVALSVIKSLFPVRGLGPLGLSAGLVGALFFAVTGAQALTGLALVRSRTWMYRPLPIAGFTLAGLAGLALFAVAQSPLLLGAAAILFGVYGGFFFFFIVFHALVHPQRAAVYVSVNESVVGSTGFLAPLAAGAAADHLGYVTPLAAAAALIIAATVLQAVVLRPRPAAHPAVRPAARVSGRRG